MFLFCSCFEGARLDIVAKNDTEDLRVSRRGMLVGVLSLPALGAAKAEIDPAERIRRDAAALADSMAAAYGGEWSVLTEGTFTLVQKVFPPQPQ